MKNGLHPLPLLFRQQASDTGLQADPVFAGTPAVNNKAPRSEGLITSIDSRGRTGYNQKLWIEKQKEHILR
jgi:hypothetical protein